MKAHGMILGDDKTGDDLVALVRDALVSAVAASKSALVRVGLGRKDGKKAKAKRSGT